MRTVQIEKRRVLVEEFFLNNPDKREIHRNLEQLADMCSAVDRDHILNIRDMLMAHLMGYMDLSVNFDNRRLLIYSWAQTLARNIRLCRPDQVVVIGNLLQLLIDLDNFKPPSWPVESFQ